MQARITPAALSPRVQRKCDCAAGGDCGCGGKKRVQRKARDAERGDLFEEEADRVAEQVPPGAAQPLAWFERALGHDFSRVRIHDDAAAHSMADSHHARAFTYGSDVYFARGELARNDASRLIAHELAHTVQQGAATTIRRKPADEYAELRRRLSGASVTPADAHRALEILYALDRDTLRETVDQMETDGILGALFNGTPREDAIEFETLLQKVQDLRRRVVKDSSSPTGTSVIRDSCTPAERLKLDVVHVRVGSWLDLVVRRVDAFLSAPADPANKEIGAAINLYFKTTDPQYVRILRDRLDSIRTGLRSQFDRVHVQCAAPTDPGCAAAAYARDGVLTFCPPTLQVSEDRLAPTFLHEAAHALAMNLGGEQGSSDRGYFRERIFRHLTREEAFDNAESYTVFVAAAAGETHFIPGGPQDDIQCDAGAKEDVEEAVARAANINTQVVKDLASMSEDAFAGRFAQFFAAPAPGRAPVYAVFLAVSRALNYVPLQLTCVKDDPHCTGAIAFFWKSREPSARLHVCPTFLATPKEAKVFEAYRMLFQYARNITEPEALPYINVARNMMPSAGAPRLPFVDPTPRVLPSDHTAYWSLMFLTLRASGALRDTDPELVRDLVHGLGKNLAEQTMIIRFTAPRNGPPRYDSLTNTLQVPPQPWLDEGQLLLGLYRETNRMTYAGATQRNSAVTESPDIRAGRESARFGKTQPDLIGVLARAGLVTNVAAATTSAEAASAAEIAESKASKAITYFPILMVPDGRTLLTDQNGDDISLGRVPATFHTLAEAEPWLRDAVRMKGRAALAAAGGTVLRFRVYDVHGKLGEFEMTP